MYASQETLISPGFALQSERQLEETPDKGSEVRIIALAHNEPQQGPPNRFGKGLEPVWQAG